jgi:hypothetical protein
MTCAVLVLALATLSVAPAQPAPTTTQATAKRLNPTLLNLPPNTWVKLKPDREPEGRSYTGVSYGAGRILYFGGGHGSYRANDVEVYDPAANTWTQLTEPEDWRDAPKWTHLTEAEKEKVKGIGGGWGVPYLSPKGRPLTEHTFQMKTWFPEEQAFFMMLTPGLWAFDPDQREWRLVTKTRPKGTDIHNWNLTYDPDLKTVISIFGDRERGLWVYDREARSLVKKFDTFLGRAHIYSTYDAKRKRHVVAAQGNWFSLDMATGQAAPIKKVPVAGAGATTPSLEFDPASGRTLVVTYHSEKDRRVGGLKTFAYDPDKDAWSEFKLAGTPPTGQSDFDYLVYDPEHRCHLFVNVLGVQGSRLWGGKVDGVFAFRFQPDTP